MCLPLDKISKRIEQLLFQLCSHFLIAVAFPGADIIVFIHAKLLRNTDLAAYTVEQILVDNV